VAISVRDDKRLLLIDTCGETAGVALASGDHILAAEDLARGSASVKIVAAISRLLYQLSWQIHELHAIGVVIGPGSFTGTRAGLAIAKGLCEALAAPLAAVSRLEVLAHAAGLSDGFAALDAGRNEIYTRDVSTRQEWLSTVAALKVQSEGRLIAIADDRLQNQLAGCNTILHPLHVANALSPVLLKLRAGGSDVALTDANYVRQERDIYPNPSRGKA
jgi:tRNA threonylcarbamoyladenosine biosynthesis protein TsaB